MKRKLSGESEFRPLKKMKKTVNTWFEESVFNPKWKFGIVKKPEMKLLDNLEITKIEKKIFGYLMAVVKHFDMKETILRCAGGWVRDKLLGRQSDDIDIALNNMMGEAFCEKIVEYEKENQLPQHHFGVIKSNPEQSKHLETATLHLFGQSIDFCNLRSEEYSNENTRIPSQIRVGTPLEDSLRRDFTINALFYNINEEKVEDFTKKGLGDLKAGFIRTPLDPHQTYCFRVDPKIFDVVRKEDFTKILITKVSRERIGKELQKILLSVDPVGGIAQMHELKIIDVVFCLSKKKKQKRKSFMSLMDFVDPTPVHMSHQQVKNAFSRLRHMMRMVSSQTEKNLKLSLFLAAFMSNTFKGTENMDKVSDFCGNLVVTGLRLPRAVALSMSVILHSAFRISSFVHDAKVVGTKINALTVYKETIESNKLFVGKWLKKTGKLYPFALMLSNVLLTRKTEVEESIAIADGTLRGSIFQEVLVQMNLPRIIGMKTIVNGKDIALAFKIKPGKEIGDLIKKVTDFQILNENCTKEDALEYLRRNRR